MAMADYRLCDKCGEKAFYDAHLGYDKKGDYPFLRVGKKNEDPFTTGYALLWLGDWAVLCTECAKTHRTAIIPRDD